MRCVCAVVCVRTCGISVLLCMKVNVRSATGDVSAAAVSSMAFFFVKSGRVLRQSDSNLGCICDVVTSSRDQTCPSKRIDRDRSKNHAGELSILMKISSDVIFAPIAELSAEITLTIARR